MLILSGHRSPVHGLTVSPDGSQVASVAGQGTRVSLWDPTTGRRRFLKGGQRPFRSCLFSPDGNRVAGLCETTGLYLWDSSSGELIARKIPERYPPDVPISNPDLLFSADGNWVYVSNLAAGPFSIEWLLGLFNPRSGHCVRRWALDGLTEQPLFTHPTRPVKSVVVGRSGRIYVLMPNPDSPDGDASLAVCSSEGAESVAIPLPKILAERAVTTADERFVAVSGRYGLWRLTLADRSIDRVPDTPRGLRSVVAVPGGSRVLTGWIDGAVRMYDLSDLRLLDEWDFGVGAVESLATSEDGQLYAAGGERDIVVWDAD